MKVGPNKKFCVNTLLLRSINEECSMQNAAAHNKKFKTFYLASPVTVCTTVVHLHNCNLEGLVLVIVSVAKSYYAASNGLVDIFHSNKILSDCSHT